MKIWTRRPYRTFPSPQKFPWAHLQCISSSTSGQGNHLIAIFSIDYLALCTISHKQIHSVCIFCVCLSHRIVFVKFICYSISNLYPFYYWVDSTVWVYHILLICSPTDRHLGSFQFLAIVNKAAMNVHI